MYPYKKPSWTYCVIKRPLRTLEECLTLPPWGRGGAPSEYDLARWKEKTRDFAPVSARLFIIMIMFILYSVEVSIGLSIWLSTKLYIFDWFEDRKVWFLMLFMFFSFIIILNGPIMWTMELVEVIISKLLKKDIYINEWIKFIMFSMVYSGIILLLFVTLFV